MIHSRPSTPDDAETIQLRAENLAEFQRLSIADPVALMRQIIATAGADAVTFLDDDGNTLAIAGVTEDPKARRLYPWLLSSALVGKHARALLVIARHFVRALHEHHRDRTVCGYIGATSHRTRAFIEHLGFCVTPDPATSSNFFYLPAHV